MNTRTIQVESTTLDELVDKITTNVTKTLDEEKKRRDAAGDPRYISSQEVAKIFDVSVTTIYNWELAGTIKGYKIGGRRRYLKEEVLASPKLVRPGE